MTRTGSADLSGLAIDRDTPPPPRRVPRGLLLAVAGVIVAAAALLATMLFRPRAADVSVARAEAVGGAPGAGASEVLTASGYVVARQRASVSTEVAGRLEALHVSEGSRVREGQVLGVLRNEDQRASVASAQASLRSAEAAGVEAAASARELALQLRRSRELLERGLVSQAEFDEVEAREEVARARVQSAAAEVENARSRLRSARIEYDKTFIRAPFAGAVLRKEAEVGEIVSPIPSSGGLTRGAIVTMANLATLEVEVDVNEGYVGRAREGMRAEIALDAYPSERYPGRVRQIVPTADRQKATVQVKVSFDSLDTRVLPEMGAKVTFLADPEPAPPGGTAVTAGAVTVPTAAVRERDGRAVVFVVEDGRAVARSVTPRPMGADRVVLTGGVAPGEMVVVEGPEDLADRAPVRVR
jgi:RND family efflux transporter MFP subunit